MKFHFPQFIHDMPTFESWMTTCPKSKLRANLGFKIELKIYWRTVLSEAQNHRCCYCGVGFSDQPDSVGSPTIEHVVPRSLGGPDHPNNYVIACYGCNTARGVMPAEQFVPGKLASKATENKKKELRAQLKAGGIKFSNSAKASNLQKKIDALAVRNAINQGLPNTYEINSRKYKTYERYARMNDRQQLLKAA